MCRLDLKSHDSGIDLSSARLGSVFFVGPAVNTVATQIVGSIACQVSLFPRTGQPGVSDDRSRLWPSQSRSHRGRLRRSILNSSRLLLGPQPYTECHSLR